MATGAAGDGFLRGIFEVCLSGGDLSVQRRPYHKNCGCEIHKSRGGHCSLQSRNNNVSYPIRRSWSEGSLALMGAVSGHSSPCSATSPAVASPGEVRIRRTQTQLVLCKEDDDHDDETQLV